MVMGSRRWILLILPHVLHLVILTLAQPELLANYCLDSGNYTSNSRYQTNLRTVFSSLSSNTNISHGFYNVSIGRNSDKVNAIGLCRGDAEPDICGSCLNKTAEKLRRLCPNQKEAIGWDDYCMLRYSNRSIFHTNETLPDAYVWNTQTVLDKGQFNQAARTLLDSLRVKAARGDSLRKFATGNLTVPNNSTVIFGLVQCTPDLSGPQCSDCLDGAVALFPKCCDGKIGGRVLRPSCNFRYEIGQFYNETLVDAPPQADAPAPPSAPPQAVAPPQADAPSPAPASVPPQAVAPPQTDAPAPVDVPPQSNAPAPIKARSQDGAVPPSPPGRGGKNNVALITVSSLMAAAIVILVL